jgi:hypothetical protein
MALALQKVSRSQADHSGTDDTDVHRASLEKRIWRRENRVKKSAMKIALNLAARENYFAGGVLVTVRLTVPSALTLRSTVVVPPFGPGRDRVDCAVGAA